MKIEMRVEQLMQESGATPMDLVRFGMAQGSAYNLLHRRISRIDLDTLVNLCNFFTMRLGRKVYPGDIIVGVYEP